MKEKRNSTKKQVMEKNGITLIALVVTIVVLLILAGITISLVFSENGIITKAQEAANKTKEAVINEQEGFNKLYNELVNALDSEKGEKWDEENVYKVVSEDGIKVPVPNGYVASEATGENTVIGGFVIYEGEEKVTDSNVADAQTTRNQFVWVPVNNINEYKLISWNGEKVIDVATDETPLDTYYSTKIANEDVSTETIINKAGDDTAGLTIDSSKESIETYGGFYVGRYEASYDISTNKVETKKNKQPYTNVSYQDVLTLGLTKQESRGQITGLNMRKFNNMLSGKQWDAMIKWINETNDNLYDNKGNIGTDKINTGSNEDYKVNNIYDISGNVAEWSTERYGTNENVTRGGAYNQSNIKANQREHNNGEASEQIGFRQNIVLPIKLPDSDPVLGGNQILQ